SLDSTKVPLVPVERSITDRRPVPLTEYVQRPSITTLNVAQSVRLTAGQTAAICVGKRIRETLPEISPVAKLIPFFNAWLGERGRTSDMEPVVLLASAQPPPSDGNAPAAAFAPAIVPAAAAPAPDYDRKAFSFWIGLFFH